MLKYHLAIGMQCPNWPGLITCSILEQRWSWWIVRRDGGPQENQVALPREMVTRYRAAGPLISTLDFKEKMSPWRATADKEEKEL